MTVSSQYLKQKHVANNPLAFINFFLILADPASHYGDQDFWGQPPIGAFRLQGIFSLQYHKWPLGNVGNRANDPNDK